MTHQGDLAPVIAQVLHMFRRLIALRGRSSERALLETLVLSGIAREARRELTADEVSRARDICVQICSADASTAVSMPGEFDREARIDREIRRSEGLNGFEIASGQRYETFRLKTV
ncbi:MAG: hypothetical protein AAGK02_02640 [Pseudomonadota bacterium]